MLRPRGSGASAGDIVLITLLLAAGIMSPVFLPAPGAAVYVEINTPGKSERVPLDKDRVFEVEGKYGPAIVEVKGGRVRIVRSTCSDNHRHREEGWAGRSGQALICLPNQVVLTLAGSSFDSVVR